MTIIASISFFIVSSSERPPGFLAAWCRHGLSPLHSVGASLGRRLEGATQVYAKVSLHVQSTTYVRYYMSNLSISVQCTHRRVGGDPARGKLYL